MTRSFLKGLTIAACLTLVAQPAWSIDPSKNTVPGGRTSTIPASNDPAPRLVPPSGFNPPSTQVTSNQMRDRLGNVLVPDPTRFEYNPSRPAVVDTMRPAMQVKPTLQIPGVQPHPLPPTQPSQQQPTQQQPTQQEHTQQQPTQQQPTQQQPTQQ